MKIIETDGIELYYGNTTILNNIYFKAERGLVTGILGSNGCGKTSLLKIIYGSLQPKYKSIRVNSKRISKPLYLTGKIKYLPQFYLLPNSIKLLVAFDLYGSSFSDFTNIFDSYKKYKTSRVKELSGGERRLAETYLILKSPSKIVLLDEPFSHISPLYIEDIKKIITYESQKKIIIITDHLYKHIVDISNDLYLIKDGFAKKINKLDELEFYKYANINNF